jgi:hypothetical protein
MMESFSTIKRRTTDLIGNVQQNAPAMPQMPQMPQMPSFHMPSLLSPKSEDMKGTWERIDIPRLPRSSHSLNVISGAAYIFGGETNGREPTDNDMHVVTLPFSAAAADYYRIKAQAATPDEPPSRGEQPSPDTPGTPEKDLDEVPLESAPPPPAETKGKQRATAIDMGNVPEPRVGHATAVIGNRIFVFGGRSPRDSKPLEEAGRVWAFDIRTRTWSYYEPAPAILGGSIVLFPPARSHHCAAATDRPRDFAPPPRKQSRTWKEWAIGDVSKTGIPQDPIVGNVAEDAVDQEAEGYGTFIVHGGILAGGDRTNDVWAFDVRTRTWTEMPSAPEPARSGASICISKSRMFRFGGFDGQRELGGRLDFLHLEIEMFDDRNTRGEMSVHARGGWQSIIEDNADASSSEIPIEPIQAWPAPRSGSSLETVNLGGGREFLVLSMGESSPSSDPSGASYHSDVWAFQPPPLGMTPASFTAAWLQAVGRKTGEGKWSKLVMGPYDDENDEGAPAPRGLMASAPMGDLEESGIVILGGQGGSGQRLADGWILRLE